jgi:sugar transferase (PEP-CTERM/EpsH1 system associated)
VRILYLCHRFPFPPARGGKIRPFQVIRHLGRSHQVTVASLVRSEAEARAGEGLGEHCTRYGMARIGRAAALGRMVARLPTRAPSSMGYFYSPALARFVATELARTPFDLIFVHCSSVAQYVEDVRGIPKILDFGDMDSQKWLVYARVRRPPLSWGYRLEGVKLERVEKALARKFDACTCTTRAELRTLEGYGVGGPIDWFPNGVDSEYFSPGDGAYDPERLSFIGRMDYYPNQAAMVDFCRRSLPLIRARRPRIQLDIVGAEPSSAVRRLGRIPGVTVTGSVPDVRPYARRSAVTVAPLHIARGTQNKILEARAMGVPVVASVQAAGGIDAVPGEHFLTASSPQEYADAVLRLLADPGERRRLSMAGRERMLSHHSWARSMGKLDRIIAECLERCGGLTGADVRRTRRVRAGR